MSGCKFELHVTSMSCRRSLEQIQARSLLPCVVATRFGIIRLMSPGIRESVSFAASPCLAAVWRDDDSGSVGALIIRLGFW